MTSQKPQHSTRPWPKSPEPVSLFQKIRGEILDAAFSNKKVTQTLARLLAADEQMFIPWDNLTGASKSLYVRRADSILRSLRKTLD